MIIGKFTYMTDERSYKGNHYYRGNILTMCLVFENVRILPMGGGDPNDPDYRVVAEVFGADVEVGAGWKRTDSRGRACVEITLDDPGLPAPLTAVVVSSCGDGESFVAEWTRPQPKEVATV